MVDSLKAKNCKVIVCLSHLGLPLDALLGEYVPGINVVVGGHGSWTGFCLRENTFRCILPL
jgi:2',3'-cyclic-nucleotide 2'-phosphodiesterase (5'-nucleotidase family)